MKIYFAPSFLSLFFITSIASAQRSDTTGSVALFQNFMLQINPKHVSWVKSSAKTVNEKKLEEQAIRNMSSQYAVLGSLSNSDIEALAFLVMMQSAKDAQEDIKGIMNEVKEINKKKQALRQATETMKTKDVNISPVQLDSFRLLVKSNQSLQRINTTNAKTLRTDSARTIKTTPVTNRKVTKAELNDLLAKTKSELDSMSEMGEMESLRLQMTMDRMSKMMSTVSNLLKKISDTSNTIVQNLK